ncbi:MAG: ABC transporter ATP-binding protein [Ruminiclostridium sp.]|nr:ABC transporter ATP-binding protein [Ruminiclostridium sp.]
MLELQSVSFGYGEDMEKAPEIRGIDMSVKKGECILLCGTSGCGKSTILKTINGIIPNLISGRLDGSVFIDGKSTDNVPMYELAAKVSSVFQNPKTQFFNTDAESEITYGLENRGMPVDVINERLEMTVSELKIESLRYKSMFEMSGGEKQRIAFASAYISDNDIIVLDEPSANLDPEAIDEIWAVVAKMKENGRTIIIAEHRLYYLEGVADAVLYIAGGEIRKRYDAVDFFSMTDDERKELGLRKLHKNDIKITTELPLHTEKPILTMNGITLAYKKHIVQNNLGFEAYHGEIIGIVGSNGAGKTTLLRALAGLCKPKKGVIKYNGKALSARQLRRLCGLVMQDVNYQLFSDSVRNEILLENSGMDEQTLPSILCETGLSGLEDRHPQSLSDGQKQRLAIAAAYTSGRKILLLDEPTSGLDYRSMLLVGKLLKKLSEKGVISIVVTHDTEFIESVCGRIFRLEKQ